MYPPKPHGARPVELHISSLVVHSLPRHAETVAMRIAAIPGAELRGSAEGGKLVVLLETSSESEIVERLNAIQLLDGVLAATLVFHHVEPIEPAQASSGECAPCTRHVGN
ncbi:chaperone NapD [Falsiroseomonas sp. HW251]|uniref:chaperone NapD n=1 Tax=Falsiroseomonas sp. HW251 TaxID=3390998 RepID=UPI003D318957